MLQLNHFITPLSWRQAQRCLPKSWLKWLQEKHSQNSLLQYHIIKYEVPTRFDSRFSRNLCQKEIKMFFARIVLCSVFNLCSLLLCRCVVRPDLHDMLQKRKKSVSPIESYMARYIEINGMLCQVCVKVINIRLWIRWHKSCMINRKSNLDPTNGNNSRITPFHSWMYVYLK